MFWQEKNNAYNILIPPLNKPLQELSKSEAKTFYEWYIAHIPERIQYLSKCCAEHLGVSEDKIDLSPTSLVYIWKWFLSIAEIERTPKARLNQLLAQYSDYPYPIRTYMINLETKQFSLQTEYIIRDVGMYIGEVFTKTHASIRWGYYTEPKTDFFVNTPVLIGFADRQFTPAFQMAFEPIHMVGVIAANIWDNTQRDEDLINLYFKWVRFIP